MNKFNLTKFLVENKLTRLGRLSEGFTEGDMPEGDMPEELSNEVYESEVEEDYSKYGSVEELMKQIETSTNEAAMKHKMERVKKAYESLEAKAASLEEGEHASYMNPGKIKEMKVSSKKLRMMHEKLMKDYDKKYSSKKKVELNEALEDGFELSAVDVASMVGNGPMRVYKRGGGKIQMYSNGQEFLDFFDKFEKGLMYKEEQPGMFAAMEPTMEPGRGYTPPMEPVDAQAGVQSFYDRLKFKGD